MRTSMRNFGKHLGWLKLVLVLASVVALAACSLDFEKKQKSTSMYTFDGDLVTPAIDLEYVRQCAQKNSLGKTLHVGRAVGVECKPNQPHALRAIYSLQANGDQIAVDLGNIYFVPTDAITLDADDEKIVTTPEQFVQAQAILDSNKGCVQEFFAKHGIQLSLKFNYGAASVPEKADGPVIEVTAAKGRSHSAKWFLSDTGNVCTLAVHELSHHLGLPDRYADPTYCPNRNTVVNNLNIMRTHMFPPNQLAFLPGDIKLILSPLCDPNSRQHYTDVKLNSGELVFQYIDVAMVTGQNFILTPVKDRNTEANVASRQDVRRDLYLLPMIQSSGQSGCHRE